MHNRRNVHATNPSYHVSLDSKGSSMRFCEVVGVVGETAYIS